MEPGVLSEARRTRIRDSDICALLVEEGLLLTALDRQGLAELGLLVRATQGLDRERWRSAVLELGLRISSKDFLALVTQLPGWFAVGVSVDADEVQLARSSEVAQRAWLYASGCYAGVIRIRSDSGFDSRAATRSEVAERLVALGNAGMPWSSELMRSAESAEAMADNRCNRLTDAFVWRGMQR